MCSDLIKIDLYNKMLDWLFGRKSEDDENKPKKKSKPAAEQEAEDVYLK